MCKIYSKWIIDLVMTVETVKFTKEKCNRLNVCIP